MSCYTFAQLESFAKQAGFPDALLPVMAAIAKAESGGCDVIQQGQPYGTTGWGLWQITPGNSDPQYGTDYGLLDPLSNAKAAYAKWQSQGLGAWTTWSKGAYTAYLPGGNAYEPGSRNWSGTGTAPYGSTGSGGKVGTTSGGGIGSVPVVGGAANAVGGVASTVLGIPGTIASAIGGAAGGVGGAIGAGITGAGIEIGKRVLPYLIIVGGILIVLVFIGKELTDKVAPPMPSGGGASPSPGGGRPATAGKASLAEEAAVAA